MGIDELLQEASGDVRSMLEDPEGFDFRPVEDLSEEDVMSVAPEDPWMDSAQVDLVNDNVEIRFSTQNIRERYVAVLMEDDFSIIESNGVAVLDGTSSKTQIYYLVVEDDVLMYENGWCPSYNERCEEVASEAPEIYRRALNGDTDELDWGEKDDYIPPPDEEFD